MSINKLALESVIITSTAIVEQLDRLSVHAELGESEKIRTIRKSFFDVRHRLYDLADSITEDGLPRT
jgi:hypothetical protein